MPNRSLLPSNESLQRVTLVLGVLAGLIALGSALQPDGKGAVIIALVIGLALGMVHLLLIIVAKEEPLIAGAPGAWALGSLRPFVIGLFGLSIIGVFLVGRKPSTRRVLIEAFTGELNTWRDSIWVGISRGDSRHLIDFIVMNDNGSRSLIERLDLARAWRSDTESCTEWATMPRAGETFIVSDSISFTLADSATRRIRSTILNEADSQFIYPLRGSAYSGACGGWIIVSLPVVFSIPPNSDLRIRLSIPERLGLVPPVGSDGSLTLRAIGRTDTLMLSWSQNWSTVYKLQNDLPIAARDSLLERMVEEALRQQR